MKVDDIEDTIVAEELDLTFLLNLTRIRNGLILSGKTEKQVERFFGQFCQFLSNQSRFGAVSRIGRPPRAGTEVVRVDYPL